MILVFCIPAWDFTNIFTTDNTKDIISGNILTTISDHLAQFILYPIEQLKRDHKMDIYKQNLKIFKPQDFQRDLEDMLIGIGS